MSTLGDSSCISFIAPSTLIDPAFWEELYERKLNIFKLGSEIEPITVHYRCSDGRNSENFTFEKLSFRNLNETGTYSSSRLSASGALVNVNTIEVRHSSSCELILLLFM
jgi:Ubiquitin-like modifier-activating enzyme ATG7 N-terminus